MTKYGWKHGAHQGKLDAQAAGERIEALREANGQVTAEIVLDDARPKRSLLHPAFEWDDKVAAEEFRKEQARDLIRSVVLTSEVDDSPPVRAFVVVSEFGETGYTSIGVALSEPDLRRQILQRALRELRQWESRYHELQELAKVFTAAKEIREEAA